MLTTQINQHSIDYDLSRVPINQALPRTPLRVLYFLCVVLPMAFGSDKIGRIPGLILGAMVIFAAVVYSYAFISVWCFFAAWLSAYLCWHFWKMKEKTSRQLN